MRRQFAESVNELTEALTERGVELAPLGDGFRLTETGTVLIVLRPLLPAEITQLAKVIRGTASA
ncbi:hypothetical protein [Kitasatospora kifunensis]|uniref:Uncharacterized protein n=1 Tax=Kitasatospora kifunensis TaxID=58351 RepID=A0A7W7R632_KITKI|nr:hypothetical protein [Kitasatospora kifunensis]MBB4925571.1 hypothetical protein [Kitasatospora kifunensis]